MKYFKITDSEFINEEGQSFKIDDLDPNDPNDNYLLETFENAIEIYSEINRELENGEWYDLILFDDFSIFEREKSVLTPVSIR